MTNTEITQKKDHFSKGNLKIIPNPSRRFGLLNSRLFFYYEIYLEQDGQDSLIAEYSILDKDLSVKKLLSDIVIKRSDTIIPVLHGIDVSNLLSANYSLSIKILNPKSKITISTNRNFEIIQADGVEAMSN